jgi:hypothetical protein
MQGSSYIQRTVSSTQYSSIQQAELARLSTTCELLVIFLPFVIICAIAGYRKRQAVILRRQIQYLNRLWHLDSSQNLS